MKELTFSSSAKKDLKVVITFSLINMFELLLTELWVQSEAIQFGRYFSKHCKSFGKYEF